MSCLNRKVFVVLAVAALAALAVDPWSFSWVAPLLVAAACPFGMVLMMGAATRSCRRGKGEAPATPGDALGVTSGEVAQLRRELAELRARWEPAVPAGPAPAETESSGLGADRRSRP